MSTVATWSDNDKPTGRKTDRQRVRKGRLLRDTGNDGTAENCLLSDRNFISISPFSDSGIGMGFVAWAAADAANDDDNNNIKTRLVTIRTQFQLCIVSGMLVGLCKGEWVDGRIRTGREGRRRDVQWMAVALL